VSILILSPEERTLGIGIKPVYLHVSLTWTGMLLLLASGVLGIGTVFWPKEELVSWQRNFFTVAMGLYLAGFIISMCASWLNWGGIPYQEPRIRAAINVVVSGTAAWILQDFIANYRIKGIFPLIPIVYIFIGGQSPRMVLHPDNPVASSPLGIKASFISMFVLAIFLACWLLWVNGVRRHLIK
jgi:hypothetical protein